MKALKVKSVQTCIYCGKKSLHGLTHPACRKQNSADGTVSLYYYNNKLKSILAGIKYRLVKDAFPDLFFLIGHQAGFLTRLIRDIAPTAVFVPLPLSSGRLRERGFNQAAVIARMFSRLFDLPTGEPLIKTKETKPQATIHGARDRKNNIRGAFSLKKGAAAPGCVILVDDVITTGETMKEAGQILKRSGSKKVFLLSVAKG